ncbi:MAG: hypothetical protein K2W94_08090 [Alphaproteobacteria bacterium]|nr:hypothetical protein [Alphaproteobacteria bacterium]
MKIKKVKVQISLPIEIVNKIEEEIRDTYLTKSGWFLKVVKEHFEQNSNKKTKKVIDLEF